MKPPPPHIDATELGHVGKAIGTRVYRPSIDTESFEAVRGLAHRIAFGNIRDVTGASVEELRAVALLAVIAANVTAQASVFITHIDAGSPREVIVGELNKLVAMVRPLMGEQS